MFRKVDYKFSFFHKELMKIKEKIYLKTREIELQFKSDEKNALKVRKQI